MLELGLDFISSTCIIISMIYCFGKLYGVKKTIAIKEYICILSMAGVQMLLNLKGLKTLSTLITITYMYIMYKKIYRCSSKEALLYSLIIWTFGIILDIFFMLLLNLTNLIVLYKQNIKLAKSFCSLALSLVIILLSNTSFVTNFIKKLYEKISKINMERKYIFVIILLYAVIGLIGDINIENKEVVLYIVCLGVVVLWIIVKLITMFYEINTLRTTNYLLEKNNEINIKVITEYRIIKHNLESQLLGVKSVANIEAKILIDDLIKEYNDSFYVKHDINDIPPGINGIVMEKIYNHQYENIKITTDNKITTNILSVIGAKKYNQLCETLGVTLDNAIEATLKSQEKILYLQFKELADSLEFIVKNTFSGAMDLEKLGTLNYTSKQKGHGVGLFSIIKKQNVNVQTSIINNLFTTKIKVRKKEL